MELDHDTFSGLLLKLYRSAQDTTIKAFRNAALAELQRELPFDGVLWSTSSVRRSRSSHHVWAVGGVPAGLKAMFRNDRDDQFTAEVTRTTLGKPRIWNLEEMVPGSQIEAFTLHAGMQQILIASDRNPALDVFASVVVGRRDLRQPFNGRDQTLLRLLLPHLQAAMARNVEARIMATLVKRVAGNVALAIVAEDTIVLEEANFSEIVRAAWPQSTARQLPPAIRKAMRAGRQLVSCEGATVHLMYEEDHVLLIAMPASALHSLTRKQFTIASDFAQGKSYKQVARDHGLPPETVRSRLRAVYEKLSITDKGELCRRFAQTELLDNLQSPL